MPNLAYSNVQLRARRERIERQLLSIYRECASLVHRRAARIVGIEAVAEDIAQQVFIHVLNELDAGAIIHNAPAYCYRAATNLALNWVRDTRRQEDLLAQRFLPEEPECSTAESALHVRQLFVRCRPQDAAVAAHYHLGGRDQTEIARLLGVSRRTINRSLDRFAEMARSIS